MKEIMKAAAINHLRNGLDSIREAGYNRKFAREYLFHRFVIRDGHITADTFNKIVNEFYPA